MPGNRMLYCPIRFHRYNAISETQKGGRINMSTRIYGVCMRRVLWFCFGVVITLLAWQVRAPQIPVWAALLMALFVGWLGASVRKGHRDRDRPAYRMRYRTFVLLATLAGIAFSLLATALFTLLRGSDDVLPGVMIAMVAAVFIPSVLLLAWRTNREGLRRGGFDRW